MGICKNFTIFIVFKFNAKCEASTILQRTFVDVLFNFYHTIHANDLIIVDRPGFIL